MTLFQTHQVEFPGLGWEFTISRGFEIFGFKIYWYGVLIAIGVLLAISYGLKRAEDFDIDPDRMIDVALLTIPVAFLGARLYYVFFKDFAKYMADPLSILDIRDGGLAIFGGIIVAFVFGPLMCKLKKVKIWAMFDATALGFLIGQGIGRWGNFFNQEAFGGNTDLPWGMTGEIIRSGQNGADYILTEPVHPTFLYESLWCLAGFVLLHVLSKKAYKFHGMIFCGYMMWYGAGRFLIEGLRTDSLMAGTMRTSQLVAVLAVLLGAVLFFVLRRRAISLPTALTAEEEETDGIAYTERTEEETNGTAD
ncbi:MAG: prolipoprotein diacylglyceryl transferase [Clostridia bacterium]|nr:prolipoprotein diacylglyceryl transferase [Clostridia bacterium]